jgi:ankyrin repeat protein
MKQSPNLSEQESLHAAAQQGDVAAVQRLLASLHTSEYLDRRDVDGSTALHKAAVYGNTGMIHLLLASGADPSIQDRNGSTALHLAAFECDVAAVQRLLESLHTSEYIDRRTAYGFTALHRAALKWNGLEVVRTLLEAGANPNTEVMNGRTPLHTAAYAGRIEMVRALLEAGANPNVAGLHGYTPLYHAVERDHIEVIGALLEAGANPNAPVEGLSTALHKAAVYGNVGAINLLLEFGADNRIQDSDGRTSLHAAHYPEVIHLLLASGADPSIQDRDGNTALHQAVSDGIPAGRQLFAFAHHPDCCRLSLWNIRNHAGQTVVESAAPQHRHVVQHYYEIAQTSANRQGMLAFSAALHPRLGQHSPARVLPPDLLGTIAEHVRGRGSRS